MTSNHSTLFESSLKSLKFLHRGKVRDLYAVGEDRLLVIQTDRLSAFDVILPDPIPEKGRVLTEMSYFWFTKLEHVIQNHLTGVAPESVVAEDERGAPLSVGRKQRVVSTPIRRAVLARDRHCTFPGCHRTRFVEAHHVQHWAEGGETSIDNLMLLCSYHHRLLHEGGYRIRRDYQGEHYFVRADGRAIPRCGYRADDYTDDGAGEDPSMEGWHHEDVGRANPSMEVREPRGVYHLGRSQQRARAAL